MSSKKLSELRTPVTERGEELRLEVEQKEASLRVCLEEGYIFHPSRRAPGLGDFNQRCYELSTNVELGYRDWDFQRIASSERSEHSFGENFSDAPSLCDRRRTCLQRFFRVNCFDGRPPGTRGYAIRLLPGAISEAFT